MARLPRLIVPNQPHHVIQTGNNDQDIFLDADDYQAFLGWLRTAAKNYKVAVHAYVLMPNHLHLLVSPTDEDGLGQMMQVITLSGGQSQHVRNGIQHLRRRMAVPPPLQSRVVVSADPGQTSELFPAQSPHPSPPPFIQPDVAR